MAEEVRMKEQEGDVKPLTLEKKGEPTPQKPEVEEPAVEEAPKVEKETPTKPDVRTLSNEEVAEIEGRLDARYEKAKTAEKDAKKAKADLEETKPVSDVDAILEVQTATKGLDSESVEELQLRAKAKGISLTEARKDDNFKLWQDGRSAKVEKEKALKPSTTQSEAEIQQNKSIDERLEEASTQAEKEAILDELTYMDPITGRREKGLNPVKPRNY